MSIQEKLKNTKISMSSSQLYTQDFSGDYSPSFFGNSFDDINEYGMKDQDEVYLRFPAGINISAVVNNEDVPSKLYQAYAQFNFHENNFYDQEKQKEECEFTSVMGENEYQDKNIESIYHDTHTTVKDDSSNSSKKSYESLFTMVEDKNSYEIGNGNDEVTVKNNYDLVNLNRIISDEYTNLDLFIGDMLKSCPCDNLVKKQRIYKAKNIKRKRKTKSQIKVLEREFKINSSWDKEDFKRLSTTLVLNRDQVYKWFWDQKKKCDN